VHDALWKAACAERTAQEFSDLPTLHDHFMRDAERIIDDALRRLEGQK
jgi:hypothetical protein